MSPCQIIPPYLLEGIIERGTEQQREWAGSVLNESDTFRAQRIAGAAPAPGGDLEVYDSQGTGALRVQLVVDQSNPHQDECDAAAEEAFEGAGATRQLYLSIYGRNSIDGNGMPIVSNVHYRKKYGNAFWNGSEMVYGDGDDWFFHRLTKSIDIMGHELTHGVVQYTAGLAYQDQAGALNESYADVFGSLVKQYARGQRAREADWLIGKGIFLPGVRGEALRSVKAPGYAYDDPTLGKDPQPGHMDDYVDTTADNGGVHINSGIPNRAFYLLSFTLDGYAWERAGRIWYDSLSPLRPDATFNDAKEATIQAASNLYGQSSAETDAVRNAWKTVGVV